MSPETYLGYERLQYLVAAADRSPRPTRPPYQFPASRSRSAASACPGPGPTMRRRRPPAPSADLELGFSAQDVYLVLGGTGTVDVSVNGAHTQTVHVGGVPKLYTLFQARLDHDGKLVLHALARRPGLRLHLRLTSPRRLDWPAVGQERRVENGGR